MFLARIGDAIGKFVAVVGGQQSDTGAARPLALTIQGRVKLDDSPAIAETVSQNPNTIQGFITPTASKESWWCRVVVASLTPGDRLEIQLRAVSGGTIIPPPVFDTDGDFHSLIGVGRITATGEFWFPMNGGELQIFAPASNADPIGYDICATMTAPEFLGPKYVASGGIFEEVFIAPITADGAQDIPLPEFTNPRVKNGHVRECISIQADGTIAAWGGNWQWRWKNPGGTPGPWTTLTTLSAFDANNQMDQITSFLKYQVPDEFIEFQLNVTAFTFGTATEIVIRRQSLSGFGV